MQKTTSIDVAKYITTPKYTWIGQNQYDMQRY